MFSENEKEWILEAINHLKRRKARPDFSRISLRMKRKHQLSITQTRQLLHSLVESGIVVKAVYKNNTSYRDVSKWKKGKLGGQILNSRRMLKRFVRAITSKLSSSTSEQKSTGVSAKEIEEWLSHNDKDKCFLSGAALKDAIENEVKNGYLNKVEINNVIFYSVNSDKILVSQLNEVVVGETDGDSEEKKPKVSKTNDNKDETNDNPRLFQLDVDLYSTEDDFNSIRMAISETEEKTGNGSKLEDIEKWIKQNISNKTSALYSYGASISTKDNRSLLLKFLENLVKSGFISEKRCENGTFFCLNNETNCIKDPSAIPNDGRDRVKLEIKQEDSKYNLPPLLEMPPMQTNKTAPLRPPSKRKRILKDHGPDFEMEFPTKPKARFSSAVAVKEYNFPTPLDSPVSEKSETTIEQSFKFDLKKKRGRPKKPSQGNDESTHAEDEMDIPEENKNGITSEQSSVCQDDNEDSMSEAALLPDVTTWTAQQVADYFFDQGYKEESKQMLENDLDGVALGLLRRSDIVGPPTGGMLKISKLGVALKLFRDVRNLLYQGNVDNYVDPYEERAFYRS